MQISPYNNISETAYWMAAYRALDSQSKESVIQDFLADKFADPKGFKFLNKLPLGKNFSWIFNTRTKIFDEIILNFIRHEKITTVVNLAAGFDMRPYRLDLPSSLTWIEMDHVEVIDYKKNITHNLSANCQILRFACDLSKSASLQNLLAQNLEGDKKVLFITEGLIVYLTQDEFAVLRDNLKQASCITSYWAFDVAHPMIVAMMARLWNSVLQKSHSYFRNGMSIQLVQERMLGSFELIQRESLLLKACQFKLAPMSVRITRFFLKFWPKKIRDWYFSLSNVVVLKNSL